MSTVRDIKSAEPFGTAAHLYRATGWFPIPLPPRQKHPPPTGTTGHSAPYPDEEQVNEWLRSKSEGKGSYSYKRGNIGLRLGQVTVGDKLYDIIGIDVDHYDSGGKEKRGFTNLRRLEQMYGKLPSTWVSTAREDGKSGIRYFRAPAGLKWTGKADDDIDIIQSGHRFAVVWPSKHPDGGQYRWIPPWTTDLSDTSGNMPFDMVRDEDGRMRPVRMDIPKPEDLPLLPRKWVDHLTNGRVRQAKTGRSKGTVDQIMVWAHDTLPANPDLKICNMMRNAIEKHKNSIEEDASSHDKPLAAAWHIIQLSKEGHIGWSEALTEISDFWIDNVLSRQKRGPEEARREIFRSTTEALRKLKAEVDEQEALGIKLIAPHCACFVDVAEMIRGPGTLTDSESFDSGTMGGAGAPPPDEYELNDRGNAQHMLDLFRGRMIYVRGLDDWLIWLDNRWVRGDNRYVSRRAFDHVRIRQVHYAEQLYRRAVELYNADRDSPEAKKAQNLWKKWDMWSSRSGNRGQVDAAIDMAKTLRAENIIEAEEIDANRYLLGVANGVIELYRGQPPKWRPEAKEDMVTRHSPHEWIPYEQLRADGHLSVTIWEDFLGKALPDLELRRYAQMVLGQTIIGDNLIRKIIFLHGGTSTGKSTMLSAMEKALGEEYAQPVNSSIFKERESGLNPALAQALDARLVTLSELSSANILQAEVIKRITGGDTIAAELKGVNVVIRKRPAFTPVVATNVAPSIPQGDKATERRLVILPFDNQLEPGRFTGEHVIHDTGPAVLAWLVEGLRMYFELQVPFDSIPVPTVAVEAKEEFAAEMSAVSRFASLHMLQMKLAPPRTSADELEKGEIRAGDSATQAECWNSFVEYCDREGISQFRRVARSEFFSQMKGLGFVPAAVYDPRAKTAVKAYKGYILVPGEEVPVRIKRK